MEKTNGKAGKYCGGALLGCEDDEVRVSHMWEESGGENYSGMAVQGWGNLLLVGQARAWGQIETVVIKHITQSKLTHALCFIVPGSP